MPLNSKWQKEIATTVEQYRMREQEKKARTELDRTMREKWHSGEITEDAYYQFKEKSAPVQPENDTEADMPWQEI